MQILKFRNFIPSLFTFIVALAVSTGSSHMNFSPFDLPLPLLIIGVFTGYLILIFLSYPKATTVQVIHLTLTGFFINAAVFILAIYGIKYFNLASVSWDSDFIISINPLTPVVSFLFSYITLISSARFENKDAKTFKKSDQKEKPTQIKIKDELPETVSLEGAKVSLPIQENNDADGEKTEEKSVSLYEELYPQAKNENKVAEISQEREFLAEFDQKEIQPQTNFKERNEEFIVLEELPVINFDENKQKNTESLLNHQNTNDEEYFDFIPADIRLVEAPTSKDNDSKGKIASIGKLLVNNRDIEGVIESGAAVLETGIESKTNVFSTVSGEQIYEKFSKIKQEFEHIKEIALINKGGFILASDYEDKMKIHITGALIAGAYHTLQNYLAQISFKTPEKIFFETENSNNFIIKTNDEFLFSICDKAFKHIDDTALESFIENEAVSEVNLIPLIELNQVKNFAISDGSGKFVKSTGNTEDSERLAIISSALFENLKVFLMNIQLLKLSRITVFNNEEVITIKKFDNEIVSLVTPVEGLVKISSDFLKMEEIY